MLLYTNDTVHSLTASSTACIKKRQQFHFFSAHIFFSQSLMAD